LNAGYPICVIEIRFTETANAADESSVAMASDGQIRLPRDEASAAGTGICSTQVDM
jgi:hypothetical protein